MWLVHAKQQMASYPLFYIQHPSTTRLISWYKLVIGTHGLKLDPFLSLHNENRKAEESSMILLLHGSLCNPFKYTHLHDFITNWKNNYSIYSESFVGIYIYTHTAYMYLQVLYNRIMTYIYIYVYCKIYPSTLISLLPHHPVAIRALPWSPQLPQRCGRSSPAPWLWRTKSWSRPSVRGMDGHGKLRVGHSDVFEQFTRSYEGWLMCILLI